jgi:hypothetical protein
MERPLLIVVGVSMAGIVLIAGIVLTRPKVDHLSIEPFGLVTPAHHGADTKADTRAANAEAKR